MPDQHDSASFDALDRQLAKSYLQYLIEHDKEDSFGTRQEFCQSKNVHTKLLYANPHLKSIESLFRKQSNLERLSNMTLREYMQYHFYYIHLGFRHGAEDLQQRWMGEPLIKSPFDCWIYQEIIYQTKPDFIIELGVMFGGASVFFANMLDLVGHGQLIGIDVDCSKARHINHPRISYIEASSVADSTIEEVRRRVGNGRALVIADSDHEKNHVLQELKLYADFVPVGGYLVAEDSVNDVMGFHPVPNEGPQAAAKAFLEQDDRFVVDLRVAEKYLLSINPYGYLKRVR
jgi:cephalosporin hydroxylase